VLVACSDLRAGDSGLQRLVMSVTGLWWSGGLAVQSDVAGAQVVPAAAARIAVQPGADRAAVTDTADDAAATAQARRSTR